MMKKMNMMNMTTILQDHSMLELFQIIQDCIPRNLLNQITMDTAIIEYHQIAEAIKEILVKLV